jgi:ABC-type nickel/cobalt efflux system permease component RcnA
MDKKTAGLVGAISGLVTISAVEAARAQEVTEILSARSYAELLQPIPNAVALLMAADELTAARDKAEAGQNSNVQLAQDHHHHHHHHRRHHRHHHHHHHHHHHNG